MPLLRTHTHTYFHRIACISFSTVREGHFLMLTRRWVDLLRSSSCRFRRSLFLSRSSSSPPRGDSSLCARHSDVVVRSCENRASTWCYGCSSSRFIDNFRIGGMFPIPPGLCGSTEGIWETGSSGSRTQVNSGLLTQLHVKSIPAGTRQTPFPPSYSDVSRGCTVSVNC